MTAATSVLQLAPSVRRFLRDGWTFCSTEAGEIGVPADLETEGLSWRAVRVPCTVGAALRDDRGRAGDAPGRLDEQDHWFRCEFDREHQVDPTADLVFHGLATICEVWLNDERLGESTNMFVRTRWGVGARLLPRNSLVLCFRALGPKLRERHSRARWRTQLVEERNLRFYRTSLLGRMPSWCPPVPAVGPWRGVELVVPPLAGCSLSRTCLRPRLDGGRASLEVSIDLDLGSSRSFSEDDRYSVEVEGVVWPLEVESLDGRRIRLTGTGGWDGVELWWPHTHGVPRRYAVTLRAVIGGVESELDLGRVGFRRVEIVGPPGPGFRFEVNGEAIFCRGTCWTPIDALALRAGEELLRPALEQARDAGMNMLRVAGTTVYEEDAFYALCDELGILVWQDFMFATFDYPAEDEAFMASVATEVEQFFDRIEQLACIAVFCGNSEGEQQVSMLGLDPETASSELFDELLPTACARRRPDVPYWPSTPGGGEFPFHADSGTSHYFGVGAYRRPLSDALLARPRFMTECLAFANVAGEHGPDSTHRERVPKDRGAAWDFKDVTDHYVSLIFGAEAAIHASRDAAFGAALSRATSAEIMQRTQATWRNSASTCDGSLVWLHRDPWPCAGWGVIDSEGRPKSAFYGLKRAWTPVAIAVRDDGLNGLRVSVYNDRALTLETELEIVLMRLDGTLVRQFREGLEVPPRSSIDASVDRLLGGFVDSSYAYRFGDREFEICVARLWGNGDAAADPALSRPVEAIYWPLELGLLPKQDVGLRGRWTHSGPAGATLEIHADRFVQGVSLEVRGGLPEDNFFHLAPDQGRQIKIAATGTKLAGSIRALNAEEEVGLPDLQLCTPDLATGNVDR